MSINAVAPLAGAWIEISYWNENNVDEVWSLHSRERGLKSIIPAKLEAYRASLHSRERGLKFPEAEDYQRYKHVAPLAGAWIEIEEGKNLSLGELGRSTRGSVD